MKKLILVILAGTVIVILKESADPGNLEKNEQKVTLINPVLRNFPVPTKMIITETADRPEEISKLKARLTSVEFRMKKYLKLNYGQFSTAELEEFNALNREKVSLIKRLIFLRYGTRYET